MSNICYATYCKYNTSFKEPKKIGGFCGLQSVSIDTDLMCMDFDTKDDKEEG